MTITRKELYQAIWTTPASHLAKTYGISDNGLRKICRRVRVPVPDNSYWRRKELGYRIWRPPLPRWGGSDSVTIKPSTKRISPLPSTWQPSMVVQKATLHEAVFESEPVAPHAAVQQFRKALSQDTFDPRGRLTGTSGHIYCAYAVFPYNLERAMFIWQRLLPALETCGCSVTAPRARDQYHHVTVQRSGFTIEVELRDKAKVWRSKLGIFFPWMYEKLKAKRSLVFKIRSRHTERMHKQWTDKEQAPLESSLTEIVQAVLTMFEAEQAIAAEKAERARAALEAERALAPIREAERRRQEEEAKLCQQQEAEARRLRQMEKARAQGLRLAVARSAESKQITSFLADCEAKWIRTGELAADVRLARWLELAKNYAFNLDPLNGDFPTGQQHTF